MRTAQDQHFLSCDWGTSHFRLKRVLRGSVISEVHDDNGCKKLFHLAEGGDPRTRASRFEAHLQVSLDKLFKNTTRIEGPIPLVISGMASSTIGWKELPYARAPLPLNGSQLTTAVLDWKRPEYVGETVLISGIATAKNMMRGEETEAIGLLSSLQDTSGDLILCLPGTHSKHLHLRDRTLHDIQTYMTGELYAVLSRHSVLAASVSTEDSPFNAEAFFAGVDTAREVGLPSSLFWTRSRQVLDRRAPAENAAFLSGLLIGSELKELAETASRKIFLGGVPKLRDLYGKALTRLSFTNWRAFSDSECENAVVRGHEIILSRMSPN